MAAAATITNTPVGTYPGAGTGPPAAVIQADSRDDSMLIILGTGAAPVAGVIAQINIDANPTENVMGEAPPAFDVPIPKWVLSPIGLVATAAGIYISNASTPSKIILVSRVALGAGLAATYAAGAVLVLRSDG